MQNCTDGTCQELQDGKTFWAAMAPRISLTETAKRRGFIWLGFALFAVVVLIIVAIAAIVIGGILGIVLAPLSIPFFLGKNSLKKKTSLLRKFCGCSCCVLYLFCVVGWPYVVVFWLGPWSSTAVAIAHSVSIIVLIGTVYLLAWQSHASELKDADLEVHSNEISMLESARLWHLYLLSILSDWYQYSALSFSAPEVNLPPSVQELLDTLFSLGRFSIPFLPTGITLFGAFIVANTTMCVGPMFFGILKVSPFVKAPIIEWLDPAKGALSLNAKYRQALHAAHYHTDRWDVVGQRLRKKFPRHGGTVFYFLDSANAFKWDNEISMGLMVFTSLLIGVVSANLRMMACVEEDDGSMTLAADRTIQCWMSAHMVAALGAGLFLMAFLPSGLLAQLQFSARNGIITNKWYTMLERPLKLLTVGVAIQSEALGWTRARLLVTSASAAVIALLCQVVWSSNHAGLNKLRRLAWWSAAIGSTSSWIHFEIGDADGYVGVACFLLGHLLYAAAAISNAESEFIFTQAVPMQGLRRFARLTMLLVTVLFASTAGILPQLLAVNTGAYVEKDLEVSDKYSVIADSCAIYVRTTNCSGCNGPPAGSPKAFQGGELGGRLKVWGSGKLFEQTSNRTVIVGTKFQACELWVLMPAGGVFSFHCNGVCTLHASGVFVGSLVSVRFLLLLHAHA